MRVNLFGGQRNLQRSEILVEIFASLRAGNGHDVLALREHPGQGELRRRAAFVARNGLDPFEQPEILVEILALKPRRLPAVVVLRQVRVRLEAPRQEAASERAIGDEADAELAAGGEELLLGLAAPQGIFGLQGCNRMHGAGATQRRRRSLGEPDIANLSGADRIRPSRRRSPRSASWDRRGADNRDRSISTPRRFKLASQAART